MAKDIITRFKLETTAFDSKLKQAAKGLADYSKTATQAKEGFNEFTKANVNAAKSLGTMQTSSVKTKDKVKELVAAYNEAAKAYNQLSKEQQQSDWAKALAGSLDQLKTRINDSKKELNDINAELGNTSKASNGTGSMIDALTQKLTINFDALTLMNKGLGLVNQALDVAKEAFFSSEANVDAWGRTIASNESLYRSFLTTLNNSDISGFLGRIDQIIDAARKAYNELDRLGTMKTIQGPAVSAQQTENERMRMMIQTGRYIAPVDGRRASMANGTLLTAEQIRSIEQKLQQGMTKIVSLTSNEVKQTGRAIDAVYNRMAKENNMSMREFRKGTSSMAEFDKRMKGYEQYQKYEREHTMTSNRYNPQTGTYDTFTYRDQTKNPYQQYRNWGTFRVDAMGKGSYNELVDLIRQRDQQAAQAYGMQSQAFRTMNRAEGMTVSKIMRGETAGATGGGSGRGGGKRGIVEEVFPEGSMKDLQRDMQELKKAQDLVTSPDEWQKYQQQIDAVTEKMNTLKGVAQKAPEMAEGVSGLNQKAIATYQSMLQESMKGMEYGSTDLTETLANSIDVTTLSNLLTATMQQGIDMTKMQLADGKTVADLWDEILGGQNIDDKVWEDLANHINEKLAELGIDPIKVNFQTGDISKPVDDGKQLAKNWQLAGTAIQAVGSAMSQIEDPAAKVMGTIAQAVATVALTFAASLKGTFTPWDWIAAAAAGTATMISTISAIHSATGYAQGGIVDGSNGGFVGGSQFSGDQVGNVRLDSGELVLSRSQQYNLSSQLEGDSSQGTTPSRPYVSGEQIYLGLNNYLRRSGRGEIITSR